MLVETIVSALIPVGIEGIKQAITKWTGGVKPTTVEDQIKLQDAEVKRIEALAALDNPHGTPSQWVIDLRASSRYIGALVVILAGLICLYIPNVDDYIISMAMEGVAVVFGFLFGQRIVVNTKK